MNTFPPTVPPPPPVPPPVRAKKTPRPRVATSRVRSRHPNLPIRKELSAGGVVMRQEGGEWYVALLKTEHKRGEVWVLPKGHVELQRGERISDAARREVQEEAGVTDLSVKNQLGVTRFKFQVENAVVYKTVHYFLMTTNQKTLHPQAEEGLIDAAWFPLPVALANLAYETDQDIVRRAGERLGVPPTTPRRSNRRLRIHV